MQFTKDAMPGIVDGSITVTFRGWKKAQAKAGGRHRIWGELIEVDDVRAVSASDITDADARRAGSTSVAALLERLGEATAAPIWRVDFHYVGPDDRIALRSTPEMSDDERAVIQQ
ncbi:MAG: hypothetical protein JWN39_2072, partial [Ilumatobacteraceae bacterium]|nr:hypothetical protein [Ilumatobacteraceae bacterium]